MPRLILRSGASIDRSPPHPSPRPSPRPSPHPSPHPSPRPPPNKSFTMTTRSMARSWNANKENISVYKPPPENDPCPICFTDFQTLNKSTTNCGHTFCTSCLLKWFIKSNSCPCCRAQLVKKSIIIPTNADMIEALNDALHEFLTDRGVTIEQVIANPIEIHSHELQKFNRYITSIVLFYNECARLL